ncbi:MAG: DHA2 family efflux MFS transporter permease subunit [Acidimicrobiia bacterium]
MAERNLRVGTSAGRWVLVATVLGSGLAMLDATVVNIALPTIGKDFDAGLSSLQWVVNAYTLTLAGFLLLGGALGDRFGRRRVFLIGVAWFATASLLCSVAPNTAVLIAARALQGMGAALLTPGSLAILEASFVSEDRAAAIGTWSGLGGIMTAVGPFLGGWLVQSASWRWIFLINLPFAVIVLWVGIRHVPETRNDDAARGLDLAGAALTVVGLAGVIGALTSGPEQGWLQPRVLVPLIVGLLCLVAFVVVEQRSPHPLVPLAIFKVKQFSSANVVTFVVYGALAGAFFLLPIQLQTVVDFSPIASGASLLPLTIIMLFGSARAGRLATHIGPRVPMTVGPVIAGVGLMLMTRIGASSTYLTDVFPAVVVFGCGLSLTVAPLTATVLGAAPEQFAGVASAVNNDVARTAGLIAIATLPPLAGISNADFGNPVDFSDGFHLAMVIAGATLMVGGLLAWVTIRRPLHAPAEGEAPEPISHCALDAPPLRVDCAEVAQR